jgi:DNA-binding Lrp family transcriptional regulator
VSRRLPHSDANSLSLTFSGNSDYSTEAIDVLKIFDNTNLKIIEELVADPSLSSSSLASKLEIPLSSLQRRRSKLEKTVLSKSYNINLRSFGGKIGEVVINVEKGKSREVAKQILKKFKKNVMSVSTRINAEHNISAQIMYDDTAELHNLLENIKSMPFITSLQWSEIVETIGDNRLAVMGALFSRLGRQGPKNS